MDRVVSTFIVVVQEGVFVIKMYVDGEFMDNAKKSTLQILPTPVQTDS